MKDSNMPRADFIMSIVLIAFGIAVLIMSIQMPRFEELNVNPYSVPGIVPGFLGAIVAFLGVVLFIRSIVQKGFFLGIDKTSVRSFLRDTSTKRLLGTLAICLGYAFGLIGRIPYLPATFIFVFVFIFVFEYEKDLPAAVKRRQLLGAFLVSSISSVSVWAVFRYLFLVNLPG